MQTEKKIPSGFDLLVHHRDKKTGRVIRRTPYRLFVHDGVEYYERPKGSGNLFFKNGETAGRFSENKFNTKAAHIDWVPPLTGDEEMAQRYAAQAEELKRLQAEINEVKREQKYKSSGGMKKVMEDSESKSKEV